MFKKTVKKIRLKDIKYWPTSLELLKKRFTKTGKINLQLKEFSIKSKHEISYDWGLLTNSIVKKGFLNGGDYPLMVISKDLVVIDGKHRLKVLKKIYGDDYFLNVEVYNVSYITYILIMLVLYPLHLLYTTIKNALFKS